MPQPLLPPRKYSWYLFLLASFDPKTNDTIGNRTRDYPSCSAQLTNCATTCPQSQKRSLLAGAANLVLLGPEFGGATFRLKLSNYLQVDTYALFKVYGSVNRKNILIYIQQDAKLHSLFISGNCSTCFGWYLHPSSGAHTTVSTASGTCQTVTATCRDSGR